MSSTATDFDAIVIGAGPAGASAAAILAEGGRRVALLEKTSARRYAVGESLIPFCWHSLDRLGLVDRVDGSGFVVPKHSVQFVGMKGEVSKPFYFFQHTEHPCAKTWQVVREEFDDLLVTNAVEKGATLFSETSATDLVTDEAGAVVGVKVKRADGEREELRARVTVDASGRETFAQKRLRWRVPDKKLRKMAIWTYYEGAKRDSGLDEGTTTIAYIPEKGWFWYIPLANDRVSVGVVADKDYLYRDTKSAEEIFHREVAVQPWIRERLEAGRVVEDYRVTSEFSYRSRHCATDGLVLAGDAFGFLDPVFSSGVYFALWGGVQAGDACLAALEADDVSAERFAAYGAEYKKQIEPMRGLVHAFYERDFNFGEFLKQYPDMRTDLTDVLIGDLDRDYRPFFDAISEFADLPEPLPFGAPLTADMRGDGDPAGAAAASADT